MALLFDFFFEISKILSFILLDTIGDGQKTGAMIKESWAALGTSFATASWWELAIIGLIVATGIYFGVKFAAGNAKTIIAIFAAIALIFFILIILI